MLCASKCCAPKWQCHLATPAAIRSLDTQTCSRAHSQSSAEAVAPRGGPQVATKVHQAGAVLTELAAAAAASGDGLAEPPAVVCLGFGHIVTL